MIENQVGGSLNVRRQEKTNTDWTCKYKNYQIVSVENSQKYWRHVISVKNLSKLSNPTNSIQTIWYLGNKFYSFTFILLDFWNFDLDQYTLPSMFHILTMLNNYFRLHRCWWRMLETKYVSDNFEMLVTVLPKPFWPVFVTNILYLLTLVSGTNNQKMSPISRFCHWHPKIVTNIYEATTLYGI